MKPFDVTITSPQLMRGLRPYGGAPRNSAPFIECKGGIGHAGAFTTLPPFGLTIPVTFATGGFPYPQIFIFTNHILITCQTEILEWQAPLAISKIAGLPGGTAWSAVEYNDFIYLSNGKTSVIRRPSDGVFVIDASLVAAEALLDAHGQVMAGGFSTFEEPTLGFGLGPFGNDSFGG